MLKETQDFCYTIEIKKKTGNVCLGYEGVSVCEQKIEKRWPNAYSHNKNDVNVWIVGFLIIISRKRGKEKRHLNTVLEETLQIFFLRSLISIY